MDVRQFIVDMSKSHFFAFFAYYAFYLQQKMPSLTVDATKLQANYDR